MASSVISKTYESLLRPLLFRLPPETAHRYVAIPLLKSRLAQSVLKALYGFTSPAISTNLAGIQLKTPVGLAAGYDKNCEVLPGLSSLGFGYLTCGTVTRYPRKGNPAPRLLRDTPRQALINSLGFPGDGLDAAVKRIRADRQRLDDTPLVVSVSGIEVGDIALCHKELEPLANAIEVNISSPNTANLRVFHNPDALAELLDSINESRQNPLFVKMPPFPVREDDPEHHDLILSLADVCVSKGVEALTIANTQPVQDARLNVGSGGLSGKPVFRDVLGMVKDVRERVGNATHINACGGVFTDDDAWQALQEGADTVQLFTGLVYKGPSVARDISAGLARKVENHGLSSVRSIRRWVAAS